VNLNSKSDAALVAYLISEDAGHADDVLPAKRSNTKPESPVTIVYSHSCRRPDDEPNSGNRLVECYIEIRTNSIVEETQAEQDPKLDSDERVEATQAAFNIADDPYGHKLGAAITAAARGARVEDFTCESAVIVEENQGFNARTMIPSTGQMGNNWIDTIHLELLVAPGLVD